MDITSKVIGSWNHPGKCPQIHGSPVKAVNEIKGFAVGDQRVMRGGEQNVYMGDIFSTSLISRAIGVLPVDQPWQAIYAD